MDLNEIQYFTWVAQTGSFSAAAKQAGVPKSTLSRKVSDLEKRLGVTLLRRTTRQIKLTDVGANYLQVCLKALTDLESAETVATETQSTPSGKLRIAAPVEIGSFFLAKVATDFVQKYPQIDLEFVLDDAVVDLIDQKIDLAVRAGSLPDSNLIAQKIGTSEMQLFASNAYLKKYGEPKNPKDLEKHCCLVFPNLAQGNSWELKGTSGRAKVNFTNKLTANQLSMIRTLAISGAGIALLPVFVGHEEVVKQNLVRVLSGWSSDREPMHAVYVNQPFIPQRTRLFLDALKKLFQQCPQ
jgi:DNA-binding transcriptional LysR family regulator